MTEDEMKRVLIAASKTISDKQCLLLGRRLAD
jgi:hypothetical protein